MTTFQTVGLSVLLALSFFAVPSSGAPNEKAAKVKVFSVKTVTLSRATPAGAVKVEAMGQVTTGGWTAAALVPSPDAPADGKTHLDFVAARPTGIHPDIVSPVSATTIVQGHAGVFTVVVHARDGSKEESIKVEIGDAR